MNFAGYCNLRSSVFYHYRGQVSTDAIFNLCIFSKNEARFLRLVQTFQAVVHPCRPVIREEVQVIREHHPVQKEFIVEARPTGREREVAGAQASEVVGTTVREIPAQTVVTQAVAPTVVAQPVATTTQTTTGTTGPAGGR